MLANCGRLLLVPIAVVALGVGALGCDEADEVREDVEEGIDDATARTTAEGFRVAIRAQDTDGDTGGVRNIDALNSAAEDIPGDPDIVGIEDTTGDGIDDDGLVEIRVGDQRACVELPESGNEIDVTDDPCF
ncbi:MAG: hypothetical protein ACRDZV_14360 [Acidimicrobiia bacterium]